MADPSGVAHAAGAPEADAPCNREQDACSLAALDCFVKELSGWDGDRMPAVQFLLQRGACTRCCVRFAGKPGSTKIPDSTRAGLLDAVAAALRGEAAPATAAAVRGPSSSQAAAPSSTAEADVQALAAGNTPMADATPTTAAASTPAAKAVPDAVAPEPAAAAAAPASAAAAPPSDPVCPLCLGILQSLDAGAAAGGGPAIALPDTDAAGGTWHVAERGSAARLADLIRREGHETVHFALSLSVPAATQARQLAALHALSAALPGESWPGPDPAAAAERLPDVKTALRGGMAAQLGRALGWQVENGSDVVVSLMYMHPGSNGELDFLLGARSDRQRYKRRRGEREGSAAGRALASVGRAASESIANSLKTFSAADLRKHCGAWPASPAHGSQVAVKVARGPVWVAGRYRKLGRDISNSPWLPGKCVTSVSEELARGLLPTLNADSYKFNSAGREDFDVRMLGHGRPFTLEFANSRPATPPLKFFARAQAELNARGCGVEVEGLRAARRADAALLKEGEEAKQKSYRAVCRLSSRPTSEALAALNASGEIVLAQQTPVRVAKRRADLVRKRSIYSLRCEMVPDTENHCVLELRTQAGTYIKEFVHSDEGRTNPSLGSLLGCKAVILQLDVLDIHMDF